MVAHSIYKTKQAIGKTVSIARLSVSRTMTNHKTIDAKPKTGEIVMRSRYPDQNAEEKQKDRVQRLAEAGKLHMYTFNAKTGIESSKNFFLSNLVSL